MGNERLQLEIVGKASGQADIDRLLNSFNKYVDAVDKGTSKIESANKRQTDSAKKQADSAAGIASSIRGAVANPFDTATAGLEKFVLGMGRFGGVAVGVVGGAAAVTTGLIAMTNSAASSAREQLNLAERLGLSVGQTRELSAISRLAGVDITAMEGSTRILAAALEDSGGKGAKAAEALQKLGIATRQSNGESRETGAVLLDTIKALSGVANQAERTSLQNQILGRGSKEIAPLIAGYKDFSAAAAKLGIDVNAGPSQALLDLNTQLTLSDILLGKLKKNIAEKVAPLEIKILTSINGALKDPTEILKLVAGTPLIAPAAAAAAGVVAITHEAKPLYDFFTKEEPKSDPFGIRKDGGVDLARKKLLDDITAQKGVDLGKRYEGLVTSTPEYIQKQLTDVREKITVDSAKILNPAGAGPQAVEDAKNDLVLQRAKEVSLEAQLKSIERQKANAEDLVKLVGEESAKRAGFLELPTGAVVKAKGLPSQQELDAFAARPGVTPGQVQKLAGTLQERFILESRENITSSIERQKDDSAKVEDSFRKIGNPNAIPINETIEQFNARNQRERAAFENFQQSRSDKAAADAAELAPIQEASLASQRSIDQNKLVGAFRIQNIREGPGSEIAQAGVLLAVQKQGQQELYDAEVTRLKATFDTSTGLEDRLLAARLDNAAKVQDFEIQAAEAVAAVQQKRADEVRTGFADAVVALQGGTKNFRSFIIGEAQGIEKTVLSNLVGIVAPKLTGFPLTQDPNSLVGRLTKGAKYIGSDQAQKVPDANEYIKNAGATLANVAQTNGAKFDSTLNHFDASIRSLEQVLTKITFPTVDGGAVVDRSSTGTQQGLLVRGADPQIQGAGVVLNTAGTSLMQAATSVNVRFDQTLAQFDSVIQAFAIATAAIPAPGAATGNTDIYGNTIPDPGLATGRPAGLAGNLSVFGSDTNGLVGQGGVINQLSPLARVFGSIPGLPGGAGVIAGGVIGTIAATARAIDSLNPTGNDTTVNSTIKAASSGAKITGTTPSAIFATLTGDGSLGSKVGAGLAVAGAVAGTIKGISDITRGGAKNTLGGISEAAMAIAPLTGPAAPFIEAGAAVVGLVSSLLPDLKQLRTENIQREIRDNTYHPPTSLALTFGENGNASDYDASGNARSSNFSNFPVNNTPGALYRFNGQDVNVPGAITNPYANPPQAPTQVNVTLNALDTKNIQDRWQDIGDAMKTAVQNGHAFNSEIQQLSR